MIFINKYNPEYNSWEKDVFFLLNEGLSREEISSLLELNLKSVEMFFESWLFELSDIAKELKIDIDFLRQLVVKRNIPVNARKIR